MILNPQKRTTKYSRLKVSIAVVILLFIVAFTLLKNPEVNGNRGDDHDSSNRHDK